MKTWNEYCTTRDTLEDMYDELKKRRCKATAKILENALAAWNQIEKDLALKSRLPKQSSDFETEELQKTG